MFDSIRRSWDLGRASWRVLRNHPTLMLFTVAGFFLTALAAGIVIGGSFAPFSDAWVPQDDDRTNPATIAVAAVVGFFATFVTIYFNTGLTGSVLKIAEGEQVSFQDGIDLANSRLGVIFQWTVISVTVGLILRALRERGGVAGTIASALGNIAWGVATFFVIPVLVTKNIGPIDAIKESSSLLRRTWGEQVIGETGVGLFALLITLPLSIIAITGIIVAVMSESLAAMVVGIGIGGVILVLVAAFASTLTTVYRAVLYRWATEHRSIEGFNDAELATAFRTKS